MSRWLRGARQFLPGCCRLRQRCCASPAARYNPAFYALIGTVAKPFHGYPAVFAMRAVAMVLCAALCGFAVAITRRFAATRWPMVAVLVTATPMVTYSTTLAAPNGVELSSALLLWSVLLALARPEVATAQGRKLILIGAVSAATLATVRGVGPLWLALIVVTECRRPRRGWAGAPVVPLPTAAARRGGGGRRRRASLRSAGR